MTPTPVRVLIVSADNLARAGLAAMVSETSGLSVVGQTGEAEKIEDEIEIFQPDVVVWEFPESTRELPPLRDMGAPVVAVVANEDAAALAWANGARGILPRTRGRSGLAAAISAAAEGLTAVDNRYAEALSVSSGPPAGPLAESLTERELQVLQLIAEGLPNKSIASELAISEHTVKFHINSILGKLGATSRTQAIVLATRMGLIRL